jgi:hypothetical protein
MQSTRHHYKRHNGIAGQFSVVATIDDEDGFRAVEFIGSEYGGPVVMRTGAVETFVTDPGRFGKFGIEWVQRFCEEA